MGDLLQFPVQRADRPQTVPSAPVFFFDVANPLSYLSAERVERSLGEVEWVAVDGSALADQRGDTGRGDRLARVRARAESRASDLRLPLVWPDEFPVNARAAQRAAAFACELGVGAAFALAAGRLAYCGGFDLDDPEVVAEAAAAAGLPLAAVLEAAREDWRDEELREVARSLHSAGIDELPAFRVGEHWLSGEMGLSTASALVAQACVAQRPLAPVG